MTVGARADRGVVYDPELLTDPARPVWTGAELRSAVPLTGAALKRLLHHGRVRYAKRGPGDYCYDPADVLAALAVASGERP